MTVLQLSLKTFTHPMAYPIKSHQPSRIMALISSRPSKGTSQSGRMTLRMSAGDENDEDDGGHVITLPPHQRCASHTLN